MILYCHISSLLTLLMTLIFSLLHAIIAIAITPIDIILYWSDFNIIYWYIAIIDYLLWHYAMTLLYYFHCYFHTVAAIIATLRFSLLLFHYIIILFIAIFYISFQPIDISLIYYYIHYISYITPLFITLLYFSLNTLLLFDYIILVYCITTFITLLHYYIFSILT